MPLKLIKGKFTPTLGRPDGDSIRFVADTPDLFFKLRRRKHPPKVNQKNGSVQLRFEGIDTMESAARVPYSSDATKANLDFCGTNGGQNEALGYILTNQLGPNGRPIVFAFAGESDRENGSDVHLDVEGMKESVNYKLLTAGHAYPLFYDTLFDDLREAMAEAVAVARAGGNHVWGADATNSGASWPCGDDPAGDLPPLYPKLWRRIQTYMKDEDYFDRSTPFRHLKVYMQNEKPERVAVPSRGLFTGFDNIVETTDVEVKLAHLPEEIVVISK